MGDEWVALEVRDRRRERCLFREQELEPGHDPNSAVVDVRSGNKIISCPLGAARPAHRIRHGQRAMSRSCLDGPASSTRSPTELPCMPSVRHCSTKFKRSEEHTSELQSLMRIPYAVFCL